MKIVIINNSDSLGGAAIVSRRLTYALRAVGADAKMLVMNCRESYPEGEVEEYGRNLRGKYYFLSERLEIFTHNHFDRSKLFRVDTAHFGFDLSEHPWIKEADVINLNWINQGAMSLTAIERLCQLGKPILWTMHDTWCATGICHHPLSCRRYLSDNCGKCTLLNSQSEHDLSRKVFQQKKRLFSKYSNLHLVAVSSWMAGIARHSPLTAHCDISVIGNAFPIGEFDYHKIISTQMSECDKVAIAFGAARLDDSIKGFDTLIRLTQHIAMAHPQLAKRLHLTLFGAIRNPQLLQDIAISYTHLGVLDMDNVKKVYRQSDIILSTSHFETLSGTVIEGMASGCIPVTGSEGGFADIFTHLSEGYCAKPQDIEDIANGLLWASTQIDASRADSAVTNLRERLHLAVASRFDQHHIAQQYLNLCSKFCSDK